MQRPYPYRSTIVIAIICALAILFVAVYAKGRGTVPSRNDPAISSTGNTNIQSDPNDESNSIINSDTNWKDQFMNVATSTKTKPSTAITAIATATPLTLTDALGQTFFTNFAKLKQANLTTDDQSVQSVIEQTINNTVAAASTPKTYSTLDIIISPITSPTSIHAYGNAVALAFTNNAPRMDAMTIASRAMDTNDMTILKQIDPVIASYDKMIKAILAIPAPRVFSSGHVDLVNSLSLLLYVAKGLRNVDTDPMQTLVAVGGYQPAQVALRDALFTMRDYFNTNNVSFINTEPGSFFGTVR